MQGQFPPCRGKGTRDTRLTRIAVTALIVAVSLGLAPECIRRVRKRRRRRSSRDRAGPRFRRRDQIFGSFTGGDDVDVYRMCLTDGVRSRPAGSADHARHPALPLRLAGPRHLRERRCGSRQSTARGCRPGTASRPAAGEYFLAISSFNNDPQSVVGEIFPDNFSRACTRTASCTLPASAATGRSSAGRAHARPGRALPHQPDGHGRAATRRRRPWTCAARWTART